MEIAITCKGADSISIDELKNFQGNLKKITKQNLEKLKKLIIKNGFNVPIFVWENEGQKKILDGHQRLKALLSLRDDGYEIPDLPVAYIYAENEKDARQKLLGITSQYGEFELDELGEWMKDFDDDINFRFVDGREIEIVKITDKDIEKFKDKEKSDELKPYKKVHVLLTMNQDLFFELKNDILKFKKIEGIEFEQSQN